MRAIYCSGAVYSRQPLRKRYKRAGLYPAVMVEESEKCYRPADMATLRLTRGMESEKPESVRASALGL